MKTQKLLQQLRPIFSEVEKSNGKLSAMEAVEVIEDFKTQIQNEAINNFLKTYSFLFDKKTAEKAKHFANSGEFSNFKKTLVECK